MSFQSNKSLSAGEIHGLVRKWAPAPGSVPREVADVVFGNAEKKIDRLIEEKNNNS